MKDSVEERTLDTKALSEILNNIMLAHADDKESRLSYVAIAGSEELTMKLSLVFPSESAFVFDISKV